MKDWFFFRLDFTFLAYNNIRKAYHFGILQNHRIRSVDDSLNTKVVAGSVSGYEDGPFLASKFKNPIALVVSVTGASEKIYVADHHNHVIRMLDLASQTVTTIAGNHSMSGSARVDGLVAGGSTLFYKVHLPHVFD
jgi:hypothetical protein